MIETIDHGQLVGLAVKQKGKPAVYIHNGLDYETPDEVLVWDSINQEVSEFVGNDDKARLNIMSSLICSDLFFFDTVEEQERFYRIFETPRVYASAVYAATYDANGNHMTENT